MEWTRMADQQGGYYTVAQCCGKKVGIRVYRTTGNGPYPRMVDIGGKNVDAQKTCMAAKKAAVRVAMKWRA